MIELEEESCYTFSPKIDRRVDGDGKTTRETLRYTKNSHKQVILDSKKKFCPKWLERIKQVESSVKKKSSH